jgi:hypothetical protein
MFSTLTTFISSIALAVTGIFIPQTITFPQIEVVEKPVYYDNTAELRAQLDDMELQIGSFAPAAGSTYRLKSSIGTTDTTIILSSFKTPVSEVPITMTVLDSDIGYATLDPQSSTRKEFVSFTGVTQNGDGSATLSGVTRGLGFVSPFTASSTLRKSHPGQSIFILSDLPQLFSEYARRRSNETITGQWTFDTFPVTASSSYASATTTGLVELATGGEAASSTLRGDITASRLGLGTDISTSTAPSSGNVVVVTGDDGNIDIGFIPDTIDKAFTFSTTTTFNEQITGHASTTIQVYTADDTWTKPDYLEYIIVEVVGGGGGGGGNDTVSAAGGGGGGGYSKEILTAAALSATTSVAVTIGAAGGGGNDINGSAGGTSSFGNFLSATGGGGGLESVGGGAGGAGSGGTLNLTGNAGCSGDTSYTGSTGTGQGGGCGGGSYLGGGGLGATSADSSGNGGGNYGGGGGGAADGNGGGTDYDGGDGAGGVVIITTYF